MDVDLLARAQFAFTIAFHYLFPPLSIGLGLILVIMEGLWLRTGKEHYKHMTHFWVKVFALIFGIGVASGIVLEFQFGTNWASYSRYVGDIFGSALAAEGVFAFFLESGFLAVLVFGWDRVSPKFHFFSTIMVCLGSTFSAVWIIVANSWMQTPDGYTIEKLDVGYRARIDDFWAMVFNPSSVERLLHTLTAAWMTGSFLVCSVAAYYLLRKRHMEFAKASMKIGLTVALISGGLQFVTGHQSIVGVNQNQPAKMAALEGHYKSGPLDLVMFGYVDAANERVVGPKLPSVGSLLIYGDTKMPVQGLNETKESDRPPVQAVFQAYHLMIMLGSAMLGIALISMLKMWRGSLWDSGWNLKLLIIAVVMPQLANQAGWFTAEVGRQPWIVYGLMRTTDGLSKSVRAEQVLASLILFIVVYALLLALFLYLMDKKIKQGPDEEVLA